MCDKLVFDLSNEIEGSPNIFIRKDWLNILDNQNGNYSSNQSIFDTSQLSNSNKWCSYREAYLSVPMLLTLTSDVSGFVPETNSADYSMGLKNWFGSIIHSFALDFNGTSIIQQTPFVNMWNSFKLMTTLSWNDVALFGSTIGFYPDDPLSWSYNSAASPSGTGVCNNTNFSTKVLGVDVLSFNNYKSNNGNLGYLKRQTYINYDADGASGLSATGPDVFIKYGAGQLTAGQAETLWKSHISKKQNGVLGAGGVFQISVRATIYLKHIHSFFNNVPLLKGVYMRATMNLNNSTCVFTSSGGSGLNLSLVTSSVPVGGILPFMISSKLASNGNAGGLPAATYTASLSVGQTCLESSQKALAGNGKVGNNVMLYIPVYVFNPIFENAYISSPVKNIQYTDLYYYQVLNVAATSGQINNLLTNGIANIKEVLVLPFYTTTVPGTSTILPYQSPFDPCGAGPTSPLCLINNFNVVVSGQNALYNTERYVFEHFNNQFVGCNSVNGGLTDGLTSGLIDSLGFEMEYCYYYVNVARQLPVEESVPKSIQIIGQNVSSQPINLSCFVSYGVEINIDLLTGARV